jgi:hypothetical protein
VQSDEDLSVGAAYAKHQEKKVSFYNRRGKAEAAQIRKDKAKRKEEQAAKILTGSHMVHGVDTTVWTQSFFKEVIGNVVLWRQLNPPILAKVFPADMLHPS